MTAFFCIAATVAAFALLALVDTLAEYIHWWREL